MKNKSHCISPQKYLPNQITQEDGRYKSPTFGSTSKAYKQSSIIDIYINL